MGRAAACLVLTITNWACGSDLFHGTDWQACNACESAGGLGGGTAGATASSTTAASGGQGGATVSCADLQKNGSESDIDCGGSCPPCPLGGACTDLQDCARGT